MFVDNDLCGGCGAHFDTEPHAPGCVNGDPLKALGNRLRAAGAQDVPAVKLADQDLVDAACVSRRIDAVIKGLRR